MTCLNTIATNDILVLMGGGGGVSTVELWGLWTILSKRLPVSDCGRPSISGSIMIH
jgi:hypothetical protein